MSDGELNPIPARSTAELRLLAASARQALGQSGRPIEETELQHVDWESFVKLAQAQTAAPIIHTGLSSVADGVPEGVRSMFRASYVASAFRAETSIGPTVAAVLGALASDGVEPILLKGSALAYTAYRQPAHRPMVDVDLLVRREELEVALSALRKLDLVEGAGGHDGQHHHLPTLYAIGARLGIELHHHLLPEASPFHLDLDTLRRRSEVAPVCGQTARVLGPSDAILAACLHLSYSHTYRRYPLRSLLDVAAIVASREEQVDWGQLVDTARSSGSEGAVYWPLWLAREWLEVEVPAQALDRLAPGQTTRRVLAAAFQPRHILRDGDEPEGSDDVLDSALVEWSLHTGRPLPMRLSALLGVLFPRPSRVGHLPPGVLRSPLRYAAAIASPRRLVNGWLAFCRLAIRASR